MVRAPMNARGYTLVEMMIVVAIIGIIALAAPSLMVQVNRFFIINKAKVDLQQEARAAMALINRNLRQAQSNTIVLDQATGQPYYSRIRFTKEQGNALTYYQNGKQLIQVANSRSLVISENVRYLAFSFPRSDDMSIISVSLTLEKAIYEGKLKALHMASEKVQVMN